MQRIFKRNNNGEIQNLPQPKVIRTFREMKRTRNLFACLFCCIFLCAGLHGQTWELKKTEDGIQVYTRVRIGTELKEIRIVNTVNSSLSAIIALLLDTKNYPEWIYGCKEASILKTISPLEIIQYHVTKLPVPFDNRDMILDLKITQDSLTKIVTARSILKPDFISAKDGMERIKIYKSQYKLTPLAGKKVRIEFEMYVDPGGKIPDSIINGTITKGPFNTTVAMAEQLNKKMYQDAKYPSIKEIK